MRLNIYNKGKKILGVIAIIVGLIAFVTPFTPGSLLIIFIGLQLLGIHFVFLDNMFKNNKKIEKKD